MEIETSNHPQIIEILRVQVPGVFALPAVHQWLQRLIAEMTFPNPEEVLNFLASECVYPGCQVLLGLEDNVPKALSVCILPMSPLMVEPQVVAAYNDGSLELGQKLCAETVSFVKAAGFTKLMFVNRTGHADEVIFRRWAPHGKGTKYGSLLEFTIKE